MPPRLRVPLTHGRKEQDAFYEAMRKAAAQHLEPAPVAPRRIAAISVLKSGRASWIEVGQLHPELEQIVMGIFQEQAEEGCFLVFTPFRGVWRQAPLTVPARLVIEVREFAG